MLAKIESAASRGATTVLLQGGHNPALPLEYYLSLVRETRRRFPEVTPHFFTASEIQTMARSAASPSVGVLDRLYDAGQRTLPGGGAEVLSARVRTRIAPKKGGPERLAGGPSRGASARLQEHGHHDVRPRRGGGRRARSLGRRARDCRTSIGGFTAFVPWSFKPGHTLLEKWIKHYQGPNMYLRMLAASRLYLDNVDHIQASWFSEGKRAGQIALHFGADDWGGTLFEENVHRAADYVNTIGVEEMIDLIRDAGFTPAQRTTEYEMLKTYGERGDPDAAQRARGGSDPASRSGGTAGMRRR